MELDFPFGEIKSIFCNVIKSEFNYAQARSAEIVSDFISESYIADCCKYFEWDADCCKYEHPLKERQINQSMKLITHCCT